MQHFQRSISLPKVSGLGRRVSSLILLAALASSQGCGSFSEALKTAISPGRVPVPKSQAAEPSVDHAPPAHLIPREIPPIGKLPSFPENESVPADEIIPAPAEPMLLESGLASWYGPRFHGKLTASGEVFNQERFTAAHRTLPWGSRVKVTNLANGRSVEVRINDRGPFARGRIIDVSRAAARALGMLQSGITKVRIEWRSDGEASNELALEGRPTR